MQKKTGMKKIVSALVVLIGVSFFSFLLTYLSPGDPASIMLTQQGMAPSEELLEQTREEMGLNDPLIVQYGRWVNNVIHLDLGTSYKTGKNIVESFADTVPRTLALTILSLLITVAISVPTGLLCARYKDGILDNVVRAFSYLFASVPSFFASLIVLYVLCLRLRLFNVVAGDGISGMIMPASVLGITLSAWYTRQIRVMALEQASSEYVKGLITKGIPESVIWTKHILKNCMIPMITLLGISFGSLLGGSAIVESIFSYNGVGKLVIDAISFRDYPVIQSYAVLMAVVFMVVNYGLDVAYYFIDPRTRRGGK